MMQRFSFYIRGGGIHETESPNGTHVRFSDHQKEVREERERSIGEAAEALAAADELARMVEDADLPTQSSLYQAAKNYRAASHSETKSSVIIPVLTRDEATKIAGLSGGISEETPCCCGAIEPCHHCPTYFNARNKIDQALKNPAGTDLIADAIIKAEREKIREKIRAELLTDDTGNPEDSAYNQAIDDVLYALGMN